MQDGTIDRPDIITSKGFTTFEELKKQIDDATVSLAKFIDTGKQAGVNIKGATNTKQLTDETKKLSTAQSELLKIEKQIDTANARATKAYQEQQKALAAIKQEQKERLAIGQRDAKLLNEQNASVKQLEVALNKNRVAYKNLADEEARNSKEGKELKAVIDQQDIAVKKLNEGLGDHTDSVGHYAKGMKGLKEELKLAKDEMAVLAKTTGTTSPEFVKAAAKAGDLKDQINDINDQIKITAGNKFETIGKSLKDVGSKLISLDFEGAANSAKQFAAVAKSLTFAEMIGGLQSVASTLKTVATAILTNPIFIIGGILTAVALATKYFIDQQAKASARAIENYKKEEEALLSRYDKEIALQKILGKQTFELEKAKQKIIIETANKQLDELKGGKDRINQLIKAGLSLSEATRFDAEVEKNLNEDKKKQIYELVKAKRDASNQIEIISAEQAEFERKTQADIAKQRKEDLFDLNKFQLTIAIDAQKEIIDNEKASYNDRLKAVQNYTKLKNQLAKTEFDNAKSQANLTAEAILLIDAELQKKLSDNKKNANKEVDTINKQLSESIQKNIKKAGDEVDKTVKRNIKGLDETGEAAKRFGTGFGVTFQHVTDTARFKFNELIADIRKGLDNVNFYFSQAAASINQIFANITAKRIQELDAQSKANEEKLTNDLLLAGDNEAAKDQLRERAHLKELELEKKKRAEARKSAQLEKTLALVQAAIQTAVNILKVFPNPYLMAGAAALGALEIAAIASKPIPAYQFGTKVGGHPGGLAKVSEVGSELMVKPGGGLELTPSSTTIMDIPRGTQVIPHDKTMQMLAMGALQQNGGSRQVTSSDPALLHELQKVNSNLKNIQPARMPNLVNSSGTVYGAFEDAKRNITIRRICNMGPFFKHQ